MKLKKWVQVILLIQGVIGFVLMTFNPEISLTPFIVGFILFLLSGSVLSEYGTIVDDLISKLDKLMSK